MTYAMKEKEMIQPKKSMALTDQQLLETEECFKLFDIEGSGVLRTTNIMAAIRDMNCELTKLEIDEILDEVAVKKKGEIDFSEFAEMLGKTLRQPLAWEEVEDVFNQIDLNGDRHISREELRLVFARLGQVLRDDDLDDIFEKYDENDDGLIDMQEIKGLVIEANQSIVGEEDIEVVDSDFERDKAKYEEEEKEEEEEKKE